MNRKQKIIVSITGIFLVLMILVGLTYAYFLTQITGNTNTKSISVTTANLVLEYGENTNVVQGIENAEPGYEVSKIFTATNKGNSDITYGVTLENIVNELSRQQDLVYTLTCTSYLKNGFNLATDGTITGTVDGTCTAVDDEKQFPSTSTMSVMTTNIIDTLHAHAYKLTIKYKEMGVDQSEDMGKTFSAKVNLKDPKVYADDLNPFSSNKNSLTYNILNNAITGSGTRTMLGSEVTTFTSYSAENERVLNTAPDDYGTSYYFRGNVVDNYVSFANKTWRIVRINGDGSIRIILNGYDETLDVGFYGDTLYDKGAGNNFVGYMSGLLTPDEQIQSNQCIRVIDNLSDVSSSKTTKEECFCNEDDGDSCDEEKYIWAETPYDATHANAIESDAKIALDTWYENNLQRYESYISKETLFCGDKSLADKSFGTNNSGLGYGDEITYYSASQRLDSTNGYISPVLTCAANDSRNYSRYSTKEVTLKNGNKTNADLKYPIAMITGDEVAFAGEYPDYHVANVATSYIVSDSLYSRTMTPYINNGEGFVYLLNVISNQAQLGQTLKLRLGGSRAVPGSAGAAVINLKSTVTISKGDGTENNPYIIE